MVIVIIAINIYIKHLNVDLIFLTTNGSLNLMATTTLAKDMVINMNILGHKEGMINGSLTKRIHQATDKEHLYHGTTT